MSISAVVLKCMGSSCITLKRSGVHFSSPRFKLLQTWQKPFYLEPAATRLQVRRWTKSFSRARGQQLHSVTSDEFSRAQIKDMWDITGNLCAAATRRKKKNTQMDLRKQKFILQDEHEPRFIFAQSKKGAKNQLCCSAICLLSTSWWSRSSSFLHWLLPPNLT